MVDFGPLHLGDNLSRHSPIMVKLNLRVLAERRKTKAVKLKQPAWYKVTEQQQAELSDQPGGTSKEGGSAGQSRLQGHSL